MGFLKPLNRKKLEKISLSNDDFLVKVIVVFAE
jgi:hypothetical protein